MKPLGITSAGFGPMGTIGMEDQPLQHTYCHYNSHHNSIIINIFFNAAEGGTQPFSGMIRFVIFRLSI